VAGQRPEFTNLDCRPSSGKHDDIDFTLLCSADWPTRRARVEFTVRCAERRLFITRVTIETAGVGGEWPRDALGATALRTLHLGRLLVMVREWITHGGPAVDPHKLPGVAEWNKNRAEYAAMLGAADGPPAGRKRTRDDDYLARLAADYVKLSHAPRTSRSPRAALVKARHVSESKIADDIDLARIEDWLAPVSTRGAREQITPGTKLIGKWDRDGYPRWYRPAAPAAQQGEVT